MIFVILRIKMYFIKYVLQMPNNPRKAGSDPPHRQFMVLLQLQLVSLKRQLSALQGASPRWQEMPSLAWGTCPGQPVPPGTSHNIKYLLEIRCEGCPLCYFAATDMGLSDPLAAPAFIVVGWHNRKEEDK